MQVNEFMNPDAYFEGHLKPPAENGKIHSCKLKILNVA